VAIAIIAALGEIVDIEEDGDIPVLTVEIDAMDGKRISRSCPNIWYCLLSHAQC